MKMSETTHNSFSTLPLSGPKGVYLAPSLLAADYSKLAEQLSEAEKAGVEVAHLDIMDGHFVPNLAMGPGLVKSIRSVTGVLFDVHLMISEPMRRSRWSCEGPPRWTLSHRSRYS